jgi:hypothetical protein
VISPQRVEIKDQPPRQARAPSRQSRQSVQPFQAVVIISSTASHFCNNYMPTPVHDDVRRFADVAARFCQTMETEPTSVAQNLIDLRLRAAELHLAALSLPEQNSEENAPYPNVSGTRISPGRFANLPADRYWDIFEPMVVTPDEPVCNSIADDFHDIYGDVKRGLILYEQGYSEEACWQWRFTFYIHWGEHLVGLMRALYWIVREDDSLLEARAG